MPGYDDRWNPTLHYCPDCANRHPPRMSIVERQRWGGKDWRYRCSDYSICSYTEVLQSDGVGGLDGGIK